MHLYVYKKEILVWQFCTTRMREMEEKFIRIRAASSIELQKCTLTLPLILRPLCLSLLIPFLSPTFHSLSLSPSLPLSLSLFTQYLYILEVLDLQFSLMSQLLATISWKGQYISQSLSLSLYLSIYLSNYLPSILCL